MRNCEVDDWFFDAIATHGVTFDEVELLQEMLKRADGEYVFEIRHFNEMPTWVGVSSSIAWEMVTRFEQLGLLDMVWQSGHKRRYRLTIGEPSKPRILRRAKPA